MKEVLLVFLGGGIGATSRFGLKSLVERFTQEFSNFGTLLINLIGCFLIGVLFTQFDKGFISKELFIFIGVGILGGFTTYSAFGLESFLMLKNGYFCVFGLYMFLHIIGGIFFVYLGYKYLH